MELFVSLSAQKIPYTDYDWYKFGGQRSVKLSNRTHDVSIDISERFGIVAVARDKFNVVHADAPDIVFTCDAKIARSLLGRSKPYKGRVKGKPVNNKHLTSIGKHVERDPTAKPPTQTQEKAKAPKNAQDILKLIRAQPFNKPRTIVYIGIIPDPTDDSNLYVFDASKSYQDALTTADVWKARADKLLVSAMAGVDCEVGAEVEEKRNGTRATLMVRVYD